MWIFQRGIRWESNPCLLVHSQACSSRYTTETITCSSSTRSRTRTSSFEARNDFRFTIELCSFSVDLMGVEPITPILQGSVASSGMQARIHIERSVRESNPGSCLTKAACSRSTYRPKVAGPGVAPGLSSL